MTVQVQNHIHLALTLNGSPEFSPLYTWIAQQVLDQPSGVAQVKYTLKGKLRPHVLNSGTVPVLYQDARYILYLQANASYTLAQRQAQLYALAGKRAYLVKHYHPDDGSDHTAYVTTVFVQQFGKQDPIGLSHQRFTIEVTLLDIS